MNEYQHFNELREKYFNGTATQDEILEYNALFDSGRFNDLDQETFKNEWDTDQPMSRQDREVYDRVYSKIHPQAQVRALHRKRLWMAAAAALLIFLAVGIWNYNKPEQQPSLSSMATFEGPYYVKLPDGSTITLKKGSMLTFDDGLFGKMTREVQLSGTAYFNVLHDPNRPFRVKSGRVVTTVLGTAFSINETEDVTQVAVVHGKVNVGDSIHTFQTVSPNQTITVNSKGEFVTHPTRETDLKWKDDYLVFENTPMDEAIDILEKRFAIKIQYDNPCFKKNHINGEFLSGESLAEILESISGVYNAKVSITGNAVMIEGGDGC
jgi:transmembrane sensor